jgi:hypothetical protein
MAARKSDLIRENEEMRKSLLIARKFIIITLVGLGFTPDTLPAQFKEILAEMDKAMGIKPKGK